MANAARKILMVEDGDDWRAILVLLIKRLGYETLEATTGLKAISQPPSDIPIEAGAKEILHKPIDLNRLHAVLHKYLPAETTKLAAAAS
jgi:CheY-like chemotaxis protein